MFPIMVKKAVSNIVIGLILLVIGLAIAVLFILYTSSIGKDMLGTVASRLDIFKGLV